MGIDASILFAADPIDLQQAADVADSAFPANAPQNLVILIGDQTIGPACVKSRFSQFTTLSLWSDEEINLDAFALELSSTQQQRLVAFTAADHAGFGGWALFDNGNLVDSHWTDGEDYLRCGIDAIESAFDVQLKPSEDEQLFFIEQFLDATRGQCIRSTSTAIQPGSPLSAAAIQQVLEDDLPDAEIWCALLLPDEE